MAKLLRSKKKVEEIPKEVARIEFPASYTAGKAEFFVKPSITFDEMRKAVAYGMAYPVRALLREVREDGLFTECAVVWAFNRIVMIALNCPDDPEALIGATIEEFNQRFLIGESGNIDMAIYTSYVEESVAPEEEEPLKEEKPVRKKKILKKS